MEQAARQRASTVNDRTALAVERDVSVPGRDEFVRRAPWQPSIPAAHVAGSCDTLRELRREPIPGAHRSVT